MPTRKHFIQVAHIVAMIEDETVWYQTALEYAHSFRKETAIAAIHYAKEG